MSEVASKRSWADRLGARRRSGLRAGAFRIGLLCSLLLAITGVIAVSEVHEIGASNRRERHSADVLRASAAIGTSLVDIETRLRGFQLTGRASFLEPLRAARRRLPTQTRSLLDLTAANQEQHLAAQVIAGRARRYAGAYVPAALRATGTRRKASALVGKRLLDIQRRGLAAFDSKERLVQARRRKSVASATDRTTLVVAAAAVLSVALVVAVLLYFNSRIIAPVLSLMRATERLAAGDRKPDFSVHGEGELAMLGSSMDEMAGALEAQRQELERFAQSNAAMLDGVFEQAPLGLGFVDRNQRFVRINRALADINGIAAAQHIGRTISEVVPDVDEAARTLLRSVIDTGVAVRDFEVAGTTAARPGVERHFRATYYPIADEGQAAAAVGVIVADITQEHVAREERRRREQADRVVAERAIELDHLSQSLVSALGVGAVAQVVLEHALRATRFERGMVAIYGERRDRLHSVASSGYPDDLHERWRHIALTHDIPLVRAATESRPIIVTDSQDYAERFSDDARERELARTASSLAVPLLGSGGVLGAMSLGTGQDYVPDREALELIAELADRGARALARAQLYEREHHIAGTLQQSLLPQALPDLPQLRLASRFQPAGTGNLVGGDLYDVLCLGPTRFLLWIGDVAGKGPEAAAIAGMARQSVRAEARHDATPVHLLQTLNATLLADARQQGAYMTAAIAVLKLRAGGADLRLALGGHPPPLLSRPGVPCRPIDAHGSALGLEGMSWQEWQIDLLPGDRLVMYTDGLTDAHAPAVLLDAATLCNSLTLAPDDDLEQTLDGLIALTSHPAGTPPRDDIALLGVQIPAEAAQSGSDLLELELSEHEQLDFAGSTAENARAPAAVPARGRGPSGNTSSSCSA